MNGLGMTGSLELSAYWLLDLHWSRLVSMRRRERMKWMAVRGGGGRRLGPRCVLPLLKEEEEKEEGESEPIVGEL